MKKKYSKAEIEFMLIEASHMLLDMSTEVADEELQTVDFTTWT